MVGLGCRWPLGLGRREEVPTPLLPLGATPACSPCAHGRGGDLVQGTCYQGPPLPLPQPARLWTHPRQACTHAHRACLSGQHVHAHRCTHTQARMHTWRPEGRTEACPSLVAGGPMAAGRPARLWLSEEQRGFWNEAHPRTVGVRKSPSTQPHLWVWTLVFSVLTSVASSGWPGGGFSRGSWSSDLSEGL